MRTMGKVLLVMVLIIAVSAGALFGYVRYIEWKVTSTITSAELLSRDFAHQLKITRRKGLILVQVRLNNSPREYDFIFDTGASTTMFSTDLIDELALDVTSFGGAQSNSKAAPPSFVMVDKLRLGDTILENVGGMGIDFTQMDNLDCLEVSGIIGRNVIECALFQIDYRNHTMLISDELHKLADVHKALVVDYQATDSGPPLIPITFTDHFTIPLTLDTGSNGSLDISSPELFSHVENMPSTRYVRRTVLPNQIFHATAIHDELRFKADIGIGAGRFADVTIKVNSEIREKSPSAGLLGNAFLEDFVVTTDLGVRRVYLEHGGNTEQHQDLSTFGFSYRPREKKLIVGSVLSGGSAEQVGIRVADQIVGINGVDLTDLSDSDGCAIFLGELVLIEPEAEQALIVILRDGKKVEYQLTVRGGSNL